MHTCKAVAALQDIVRDRQTTEPSLAGVAKSAMDVVHDMHESGITEFGLQTFHELATIVLKEHGQALDHYLRHEVADCAICIALKLRFQPD